MRKSIFGAGILAAAASMAGAGEPILTDASHRTSSNRARYRPKARPMYSEEFHPQLNRWTGRPHEHKREIARRLRQQCVKPILK